MFDPAHVHALSEQGALLRDRLGALVPLGVSTEEIAALQRLPEADRDCYQSLAIAFFQVARASQALTQAALAADRAAEGVQI